MGVTHTSTISGRGKDPFKTSWLTWRTNSAIYHPGVRGDDGSIQLAMYDFFFGQDTQPYYRVHRGSRGVLMGPRGVRGPRLYSVWHNA